MRKFVVAAPIVLAAFAAVPACDGGTDTTHSTSGGPSSSSSSSSSSSTSTSSSGAGGGADAITGTAIDLYMPSTGDISVPNVDGGASIEAITSENGSAKSYPGAIDAQGNISIPGVPVGPYLLALTSKPPMNIPGGQPLKSFYATDARTLDLGRIYSGRPNVKNMTQATLLILNATLTIPWQAYATDANGNIIQPFDDQLQLVSRNASVAGVAGTYTLPFLNAPSDGDTQFASWNLDAQEAFSYLGNLSLIDKSKGDDFTITHDVTGHVGAINPSGDPWSNYTYYAVQEAFEPPPFTMTDGGTSTLSGAFKAAPQKMFAMDFKGTAFNALIQNIPKNLSYADINVTMDPGSPLPAIGAFATLLDVYVSPGTKYTNPDPACQDAGCDMALCPSGCDPGVEVPVGDHTHSYSYGNPFQYGQELATAFIYFSQSISQLLPEKTSERLRGWLSIQAPASEVTGKPIQPILGFPENIQVAGKATPYDQITMGVGTTPTVTWTAPSLGKPTHYQVSVIDLTDVTDANGNMLRRRTVASISLTATSVAIPDGILQPGRFYSLEVKAQARDNDDLANPLKFSVHQADAMMFTGVITP